LFLTPAIQNPWDRRTSSFSRKTEVGSIRLRPVGGGLGVYEQAPDRTVSGNTGKFVAQWGGSADKKWQK
jgi:hypothetical protein